MRGIFGSASEELRLCCAAMLDFQFRFLVMSEAFRSKETECDQLHYSQATPMSFIETISPERKSVRVICTSNREI